ncbi:MAG: UDPGP type 1 family protein [Planctomycetes bacterium]|nr:UDPGP type 1 family protein [Planctomycetota bacterium]MCW8135853.1 UDPGP type 1 family protein [Planctomycetota bacterium]
MDAELVRANFEAAGQGHVFAFWDELGERARRRLLRQCEAVDLSRLSELRAAIDELKTPRARNLSPAPVFELSNREFPYALADAARAVAPIGDKALRDGHVAVLLVAGGQGTRLGFDGPKGCYPVLPLSGMTLFEVFARKIRRVGTEHGRTPPLYVMVGGHNESATINFWQDHEFFGLSPDDVKFFAQGEMPALDENGKLVMAAKDALFTGPDGHGGVLNALHAKGMLADMRARGVRYVSYIQVDNAQTPVADAAFLGLHIAEGAEVSLKVVRKEDPDEKVGIYCLDDGVPGIVEYSEFSPEQSRERDGDGLRYWAGSIAVHAFSVDFLNRLADNGTDLPLHAAHKKVPCIDPQGNVIEPAQPNAWKFERFIFDTIPLAGKVNCVEVPREEQFLPVKNADGPYGPTGFKQAYQDYFARAVQAATGKRPPAIEVDPMAAENAREVIELAAKANWDTTKSLHIKQ